MGEQVTCAQHGSMEKPETGNGGRFLIPGGAQRAVGKNSSFANQKPSALRAARIWRAARSVYGEELPFARPEEMQVDIVKSDKRSQKPGGKRSSQALAGQGVMRRVGPIW